MENISKGVLPSIDDRPETVVDWSFDKKAYDEEVEALKKLGRERDASRVQR